MSDTNLRDRLQGELEELVRKNGDVYSTVLGVSNPKLDLHWTGAAGLAYAGASDEMKVDTPVFIASITKMFTSVSTMIMEQEKLLSLDDPIAKYFPGKLLDGLHRYRGVDYTEQLRIYHLVSQTSGLPDYFMDKPPGGQSIFDRLTADGDLAWDLSDVVDIAKKIPAKFPPGSKGEANYGDKAYYADTNYQLLGSLLETAAQKSLHEIFTEYIFEPLGLTSTYLHGQSAPGHQPANIYYKSNVLRLDQAMTSFGPDGGLVSNIEDCLTFLRSLMSGKLFEDPSTIERMKHWRSLFFPFQYGLGLMRSRMPRIFSPFSPIPELIGHSGSTSAFLFYSDIGQLYIGGTLNQIENQGRPVRLMLKIVKLVNEAVS